MNNTDSTSFQSILAGVKRLREQSGDGRETPEKTKAQRTVTADNTSSRSKEVINSFNQQRLANHDDDNLLSDKVPMRISNIGKTILVNTTQKANPLLNHLKNTNWRYVSSTGGNKVYYDYLVRNRSVLFLTLTYHKLYNEYIFRRIVPLQRNSDNILIFVVDDKNSEDILTEITKMCMFKGFTLLLAFNFEQAAKYLEYLNH